MCLHMQVSKCSRYKNFILRTILRSVFYCPQNSVKNNFYLREISHHYPVMMWYIWKLCSSVGSSITLYHRLCMLLILGMSARVIIFSYYYQYIFIAHDIYKNDIIKIINIRTLKHSLFWSWISCTHKQMQVCHWCPCHLKSWGLHYMSNLMFPGYTSQQICHSDWQQPSSAPSPYRTRHHHSRTEYLLVCHLYLTCSWNLLVRPYSLLHRTSNVFIYNSPTIRTDGISPFSV